LALVNVLKTVLVTVPAAWPLGHGHHAQAAGHRYRRHRSWRAGCRWPACASGRCHAAPRPSVGRPRLAAARLLPLRARHARGAGCCAARRTEPRPWLLWHGRHGVFTASHPSNHVQTLAMCCCCVAGQGPCINGDGMPLPRLSLLDDAGGTARG
jgi:hypothetical protein